MAIIVGPTQWQFSTVVAAAALGSSVAGGYLICKSGGVGWIVAPASTEVSRTWGSINGAVTTANANAACGDWFVPTCGQLLNPGYSCRTYWDSYSSFYYWSSSSKNSTSAWGVNFCDGQEDGLNKSLNTFCVRAFRCVTY
jgi:hypothetical protein